MLTLDKKLLLSWRDLDDLIEILCKKITEELPNIDSVHGIAPHRVYLISLQPNCTCFLLH